MKKNLLITLCFIISGTLNAQEIKRWKMNELLQYIQNSDSALIVNFWATFCGPCVEEIPYFQTITEKYKSKKAKLLLISLDFDENYPNKIAAFAKKHGFTAEIIWLDESKPDEFCPKIDSNWSGAMPASLFVNNQRKYRKFIEAQLNPERVEAEMIHLTGLECPASLPLAKGQINDFEQIFTDAEEQKLVQLVQKISREEKAEIAIVTVEDYQPFESMQLYAFYLSNCWGVGNEDKDDGMVILISKKQRKVRITNGYGIEKQLTDAETKKIIDRNMVPFYKKGLFYRGTANALQEIARELKAFTR